jgi:hypothetical protein
MRSVAVFFAVFFVLIGSMAYAQTTPSAETKPASTDGSTWEFHLIPYAWLIAMDTKATVHNYTAESKINFSDILQNINLAGQLHFEAQKGKWGFFIDPTYLKLSQSGTLKDGRDVKMQVEQWLVEFGGTYQLEKWSLEEKGKRSITVDALGGGRFWYLSANLDTSSTINPSKTTQWVDPFIGASLKADITERLLFNIRGDVGGFSVGSDFSWNALGVFGYRFTKDITGLLGYRALYVDYKAGTSSIRYNITIHGPIMALAFSF